MPVKISRRTFIKSSIAAAGAVAILPSFDSWAADKGRALAADFLGPWGVTYIPDGRLAVSDPGAYAIRIFDPEGKAQLSFGAPGSGEDQLNYPTGIHADGEKIYVCDTNNGRVSVFDYAGKWLGSMGGLGIATAKLASPNGIWADEQWIWVANTRGHVLQRYSPGSGKIDRAFGAFGDDKQALAPGTVDYKLRLPSAVAGDAEGRIYLIDSKHRRVLALDREGQMIWESQVLAEGRELSRPQGLAWFQNALFISDTGNNRLVKIDATGKPIAVLNGIEDPHGISVFENRMAVAQRKPKMVQIIEIF